MHGYLQPSEVEWPAQTLFAWREILHLIWKQDFKSSAMSPRHGEHANEQIPPADYDRLIRVP
jgi:hypothetical protein